ncbi:tRNA lysidine(34) synthetase TilS [Halarcobacter mediterraneus]|uniref:tRNA(Ile)-lysidine synthase n=1 Tax=Halarcobacter mediterraneus TaxID=2023153 RepID=A0A4Q1AWR4_9BACT|nr:tRNA lysidine(34) synthetase TilS [Halarcobacter mediterraneus]RXK13511.1 tRNA lysidine(34) synthetase TilS [Halarcobacter mediterraneus]
MEVLLENINTNKNLLAFSGGVDSSALFFILLEKNISFDIAIINYNIRKESKEEVSYAKELAKKYNKTIFIKDIQVDSFSNFEKKARDIRYGFFDELMENHLYENLITAHQLNDKLEWFLMQFTKGAGINELLSFEELSFRKEYKIIKPLINSSKKDILAYLKANKIKYFIDKTNDDENFKRNYFRKNFSNKLLEEFQEGIKRSFEYLENDLASLRDKIVCVLKEKELEIYKNTKDDNLNIKIIDESLKKRGLILTKKQRDEVLKQKELVISHRVAVSIIKDLIYICPYEKEPIPKEIKEKLRINKIPINCRVYIYQNNFLEKVIETIK